MPKNNNRAFVVLLDDSFDVISNYFLVDSYLSLFAITSDSNEKIIQQFKDSDPIWSENYLDSYENIVKNLKEQHEKMTERQSDKETLTQKLVGDIIS